MNRTRTTIVVVALLGAMAAINYVGGLTAEEAGTEAEAHAGDTASIPPEDLPEDEQKELVPPPDPMGPEDAPVLLEVFYEEDNGCHGGISDKAVELALRHMPHIRLRLWPWNGEGTEERADELDAHCLVVVALSTRDADGEWGSAEVPYMSPPDIGEWTWGDLEGLIVTKLEQQGIDVSLTDMMNQAASEDEAGDGGEAEAAQ